MRILIDGRTCEAAEGMSVLAAIHNAGVASCRRSVSGEARGGLCGMGICFECRVAIDGEPHQRACMTLCHDGMEITTGG